MKRGAAVGLAISRDTATEFLASNYLINSVILPAGALGSGGGRELERGGFSRTGQKC